MPNEEINTTENSSAIKRPRKAPKLKVDDLAAEPKDPSSKPQIEGINAPKATKPVTAPVNTGLTEQEKKLVSDPQPQQQIRINTPKLMPQSVIQRETKKPARIKTLVLTLVVLLIIAFGGYQGYMWYISKNQDAKIQAPATTSSLGTVASDTNPSQMASSTLDAASTTPSSTPLSVATSTAATGTPTSLQQIKINSTPTGYLNVRSAPSSSGKLITQIHPGETYTYTDKQSGWYKIILTDGTSGWVSGMYATVQ